jgi:hypothetical protein
MAGHADEGEEQRAGRRSDDDGDEGGAQVHAQSRRGDHEGAGRQHEHADGQVAPQHADVDRPQAPQRRGDGFDTEGGLVGRFLQQGHWDDPFQPK